MESDIVSYRFYKDLTKFSLVKEISLFGSMVRNDHQEGANIDLAIFFSTAD